MRHSPERVAAAACALLGIRVEDLWLNAKQQYGRIETSRMRKLVVWCVREISGASFPTISVALMSSSHSSVLTCLSSKSATERECEDLESRVRTRLDAEDPRRSPGPPTKTDVRCDVVWFSQGCGEPLS